MNSLILDICTLPRGFWGSVSMTSPHPLTRRVLPRGRGVTQLYSHQAEAISHVFGGSSLVAATPTASGKSLTYCIPVSLTVADLGQSALCRVCRLAHQTSFLLPLQGHVRGKSTDLCCIRQVWGRISMALQLPGCFNSECASRTISFALLSSTVVSLAWRFLLFRQLFPLIRRSKKW